MCKIQKLSFICTILSVERLQYFCNMRFVRLYQTIPYYTMYCRSKICVQIVCVIYDNQNSTRHNQIHPLHSLSLPPNISSNISLSITLKSFARSWVSPESVKEICEPTCANTVHWQQNPLPPLSQKRNVKIDWSTINHTEHARAWA